MAESWVRLWSGMTTDPKWQTIARKSGQPRALVIALFAHLLMVANEGEERGDLSRLDVEDTASALDVGEEAVSAILAAMEGRVIEGGRLSGWDRRQPEREDLGNPGTGAMSAAERKRRQRERDALSRDVTACHAPSRDVTACHAPEAEAEAEAEAEVNQRRHPEPGVVREERPAAALPLGDAIHVRACELTALLRPRGARLNASNPDVRGWAEGGITDAQLLTAFDIAEERRTMKGDPSPVNAGLLSAILRDVVSPQNARASPMRRSKSDDLNARNKAAFAEAKAAILAREANDGN